MTDQTPLDPDEIITPDGVRVLLRPAAGEHPPGRTGLAPSTRLLALAAAPVVVPLAAAGVACLVGVGVAAASAGLARQLLRPSVPSARPSSAGGWTGVSVTVVRWDLVRLEP